MYILPVSSENKLVPGHGENENYFPVEYPVHFVADIVAGLLWLKIIHLIHYFITDVM